MINKIVDEIQNSQSEMRYKESIMAIDFETIVIVNGEISWDAEEIIKNNGYHIYQSNEYHLFNDDVYDEESIIKKQYDLRNEFGHELGYRKFYEWIHQSHKTIKEVKIEKDDFYLQKLYEEYKEEEEQGDYLTVRDLIKRLQKTDQDAFVVIEDQEWGGYHPLYNSDEPMHIVITRECPDCNHGCCSKCKGREIFEKKNVVF